MKKLLLLLLFFITTDVFYTQAQVTDQQAAEAATINTYKEQYLQLIRLKGMTHAESMRYVNLVSDSIQTFDDVAKLLYKIYPSGKQIGVLIYFYKNDTLTRVFFEPGIIKEQKKIPIKSNEVSALVNNINQALNLNALSADRSPRLRGGTIQADSGKTMLNLESCISSATKILLPDCFNEQYQHLVIIPALDIGSIPFHLLKPYQDGSYLIEKCSFTIAPGLIDLLIIRLKNIKKQVSATALYYLFTPSTFRDYYDPSWFSAREFNIDSALFISNPTYPTNTSWYFPSLPGAEREISNAISFAKKFKLLQGDTATKFNVNKYIRNCNLAYFATHGVSSSSNPLDSSFLVLAGNKESFLTTKDIMSLRDTSYNGKLSFPEMVILSACRTGLGKSSNAGVIGIARSFLLSGSNCVITSLWNVDDDATAYLMNRFLLYLQKPSFFMPAEPLRLAILDTKFKYPDPSKWASFSLFGVDY